MTRVAVTGATGFVGAAVVARLLAEDAEVVAIVRPGGDPGRLPAGVEALAVDLEDVGRASRAIGALRPELCVHLAAAGAVVRERDHARLLRLNAIFPPALARALAAAGCRRLVTAGSSSEYGPVDGPMSEERAPLPDDLYGASKLAGGLLARAAGLELGLEAAHLRLFSVYGPGEDARRLIASVARALVERRPIDLTPGDQVRDFVYVDDVAEALVAAATGPLPSGAIVNVGSGRQTTVREACLLLAEAAGADPALLRFGARAYRVGERFSWQADTSHAATALRWRARTGLERGLTLTVESVRAGLEAAA